MDLKSSIVILLLSNAVSSGTKYTTGFRRQFLYGVLKSFVYISARTKMFQMLDWVEEWAQRVVAWVKQRSLQRGSHVCYRVSEWGYIMPQPHWNQQKGWNDTLHPWLLHRWNEEKIQQFTVERWWMSKTWSPRPHGKHMHLQPGFLQLAQYRYERKFKKFSLAQCFP